MPEFCQTSAFHISVDEFHDGGRVVFDGGESAHIANVLRLAAGDLVEVLDGRGGVHRVELTTVHAGRVEGLVVESRNEPAPSPPLSAAVACGRKERLRFAVEKLAELGCHRFWPLNCEYLQFPGGLDRQTVKLQATAVSALKQSRRPHLTVVEQPLALAALLGLCAEQHLEPVFCHPAGAGQPIGWKAETLPQREYVLVVGPEGGFSRNEMLLIEDVGHHRLDLGRHWLRSETAAVAGFTLMLQYLRNEFAFAGHFAPE